MYIELSKSSIYLTLFISDEEADDYEPYYHILKETLCGIDYEVFLIINLPAYQFKCYLIVVNSLVFLHC